MGLVTALVSGCSVVVAESSCSWYLLCKYTGCNCRAVLHCIAGSAGCAQGAQHAPRLRTSCRRCRRTFATVDGRAETLSAAPAGVAALRRPGLGSLPELVLTEGDGEMGTAFYFVCHAWPSCAWELPLLLPLPLPLLQYTQVYRQMIMGPHSGICLMPNGGMQCANAMKSGSGIKDQGTGAESRHHALVTCRRRRAAAAPAGTRSTGCAARWGPAGCGWRRRRRQTRSPAAAAAAGPPC